MRLAWMPPIKRCLELASSFLTPTIPIVTIARRDRSTADSAATAGAGVGRACAAIHEFMDGQPLHGEGATRIQPAAVSHFCPGQRT